MYKEEILLPKQGQFAKSSRIKQLNNFKVKRHGQGSTISADQFTDYLLVRFALTTKKKVAKGAQETVQRFLIEIGDQLLENDGDHDIHVLFYRFHNRER